MGQIGTISMLHIVATICSMKRRHPFVLAFSTCRMAVDGFNKRKAGATVRGTRPGQKEGNLKELSIANNSPQAPPVEAPKKGIVIVSSAALPRDFFQGFRCASHFVKDDLWTRRLRKALHHA